MIDSSILNILVGVSTPLGIISILAYFFSLRVIKKNENSVREALAGEGLLNKDHILPILERFTDEKMRLDALNTLVDLDKEHADVVEKLKGVDIVKIYNMSTTNFRKITGISSVFFVLLAVISVSVYPFSKPSSSFVEKTYIFNGPFKVERNNNFITFNLTNAIHETEFIDKDVHIESISVVGDVASESDEAFGFDEEILIFTEPLGPGTQLSNNSNWDTFQKLRNGYAIWRRLLQITLRTNESREVHSSNSIEWTVDMKNTYASIGELKNIRNATIQIDKNGFFVQMFVWTLWGGNHFVEFSKFKVNIRMRVSSKNR
jgi:hypothetical protein